MPGRVVQSKIIAATGSTALSATFDNTTASGNTIASFVGFRNDGLGTVNTMTLTDNKTNTHTVPAQGSTTVNARIVIDAYSSNIIGGSSHQVTVTPSKGATDMFLLIVELNGMVSSSFDVSVKEEDGFAASASGPTSGALAQSSEIALFVVGTDSGTQSAGTGWSTEVVNTGLVAQFATVGLFWKVTSSVSAINGTAAFGASQSYADALITFKASAEYAFLSPSDWSKYPKNRLKRAA